MPNAWRYPSLLIRFTWPPHVSGTKNFVKGYCAIKPTADRNGPIEKELSRHSLEGRVVLIDCVTLWCTNYFFDLEADTDKALTAVKAEFDRLTQQDATFIFVTNEIGMGGTSENLIQRKFTDMQGWMNQYIASRANRVILMVSGIPVKVKDEK